MKTLKKVGRVFVLVILIILAASGLFLAFIPANRERPFDKEIRIEQVDRKEEEIAEDDEVRG